MTPGEVTALLAIAGRNYDKSIPKGLDDDWALALADIPENVGIAALRAHIRASDRFPTIANILAYVETVKPRQTYLPPHVAEPIQSEEIRTMVAETLAKLKGGQDGK